MRVTSVIAAVAALGAAGSASAVSYLFEFPIDGLQEAPVPVVTPGTGFGSVAYDDITNVLSWTITYSGLIGTPTVAHFHGPAPVGVAALVRLDLVALSGGSIASPMVGMTMISQASEQELLDGLWYVNIHSTHRPGGEIRGQVVPAPGALALLGLGGLVSVRRRR
ncbi:MAG TPA: CHRD domain-containing protein [Phycisphaerales bacterium]|nr:CHRD domain-containing protein [Phycisphaerales bacterium]